MRIVNRHVANLLEGYDRILDYHRQFEDLRSKECDQWKQRNTLEQEAYRFRLQQHNQEIERIEAVYKDAVTAWNHSEKPGLDVYERQRAGWRKRLSRAVGRLEAQLARARAQVRQNQRYLSTALLANLFLIPIPIALPAAIYFWITGDEKRDRAARLQARLTYLRAIKEPPYKPLSPPPRRAAYPEPPRRAVIIPDPPPNNLIEKWWARLRTPPPWLKNNERQHDGLKGEALLLEALAGALDDAFIALAGASVEHALDGDVIVVGSNGVWVLDSKYLNGIITFDGQRWTHHKLVAYPGGRGKQQWIEKEITDLGAEWEREKASVVYTLRKRMQRPHPPVIGGLAFTYAGAELRISDQLDVAWGTTEDWVEQIAQVPTDLGFYERDLVECIHHILNYAHRVEQDNTASAQDMAETVYSEVTNAYQRFKLAHHLEDG